MSIFLFTKAILEGTPIDVYNHGHHKRDFTYIDDIVEGIIRLLDHIPTANPEWTGNNPDPATSKAPYRIYNIGNRSPVELMEMIKLLEDTLGIQAQKNHLPMQPGDVPETSANVDDLEISIGFKPSTPIEEGIRLFVDWYRAYFEV